MYKYTIEEPCKTTTEEQDYQAKETCKITAKKKQLLKKCPRQPPKKHSKLSPKECARPPTRETCKTTYWRNVQEHPLRRKSNSSISDDTCRHQ
ncbi:hypothetical protein C2G38_2168151 [Gigaspora rosea]|uniref:Uncharacterized protein n=1 Tax=Gigaspora rosea TaxID=44941 RepID=A0A397VUD4_9GLOM|nr:hypothetical protein C2G38_2168151 [Gigaspora rosea]